MLMEQQLTPFGKRTRERLEKLGRDEDWLLAQLRKKEIFISKERYLQLITGEVKGKSHEIAIGKLLREEEDIVRITKMLGIKRG